LTDYFNSLFLAHNLADYAPVTLAPTWRNGRMGMDSIAKRLDNFLIVDNLISTEALDPIWVEIPFLSDHAPILLAWTLHHISLHILLN
jgi:hypothetical protein